MKKERVTKFALMLDYTQIVKLFGLSIVLQIEIDNSPIFYAEKGSFYGSDHTGGVFFELIKETCSNCVNIKYAYPPLSPKKEKLKICTKFKWPLNECEYRTKWKFREIG